jgi:hypothetical protein
MDMVSTQYVNILTHKEAWNVGLWNHHASYAWLAIPIFTPVVWIILTEVSMSVVLLYENHRTKISNKNLAETRNCEVGH